MKIVIVEDQTMFRELLVLACAQAIPEARIDAAGDGGAALALCQAHGPDLILLDLVLPDGDGLAFLPRIFEITPAVKVIALSSHLDEFTVHRAGASRVHGIIDKNGQPVRALREAIMAVLSGRPYFSPHVQNLRASLRADPMAFDKILSEREQEVLALIGEGLSNDDIAARLAISESTAKQHRLRLMAKLDMHSTPQLIRYAFEKGFTRLPQREWRLAR